MRKQPLTGVSRAYQHGVTKENNSFLGLNPNLNIEDEYIQNLLKQIHFMNMQIKLLKQKQNQSQGNSLWGVINRTSEPLVKNIVDSNQKYQLMKKQMDSQINKIDYQNIKLADQQIALITKMHHLQNNIEQIDKQKQETNKHHQLLEEKNITKIKQLESKLARILAEKEEENKKNIELNTQHQLLTKQIEKQQFNTRNELTRIKQDQDIEQEIQQDTTVQIQNVKQKISHIKEVMENDMEFQRAKQDQKHIRQNMGEISKKIAQAEFTLLQLSQTIKLGMHEREREVLERKKYMEEYESLKQVLKEIQELNQKRLEKEVQNRKRQSQDILKGGVQSKKLEKHLEDIKKKINRSEESEKIVRQETENLDSQLQKLKEKRKQLTDKLTKIVTANDQQDTTLSNYRNEYRRLEDQFQKIAGQELSTSNELNSIESEVISLRERRQYLSEALSLKDAVNQTKLEELQKVVQKNKDMNETVSVLMEKWEDIKRFSKA